MFSTGCFWQSICYICSIELKQHRENFVPCSWLLSASVAQLLFFQTKCQDHSAAGNTRSIPPRRPYLSDNITLNPTGNKKIPILSQPAYAGENNAGRVVEASSALQFGMLFLMDTCGEANHTALPTKTRATNMF